ncbi:MAG: YaeQ family protein [Lautropia sp.]
MALPSIVYKAELSVADLDRSYYRTHALTIVRHPSETEERMMIRLLAFALHADDALGFGRGLSTEDEPDLWQHDLTGAITRWIDVGWPDDKRLRRAAGRSPSVVVYTFGGAKADMWWKKTAGLVAKVRGLRVLQVPQAQSAALAGLAARSMRLNATIEDGQSWIGDERTQVQVTPIAWHGEAGGASG